MEENTKEEEKKIGKNICLWIAAPLVIYYIAQVEMGSDFIFYSQEIHFCGDHAIYFEIIFKDKTHGVEMPAYQFIR